MTADRYVARSTQIAARSLGGEMVIMSAEDSTVFTLNEVATAIWQAADGQTRLRDIVENCICSEYDVAQEEAVADAESLVEELASRGILLISDQPIESKGPSPREAQ